jgi:hypothetical protein
MPYVLVAVHDHPQRDTFPQQRAFFIERILPTVTTMPGFASGHWAYDAATSRTHSYVRFDGEPEARAMVERLRAEANVPNPFGVTLVSATVTEEMVVR